MHAEPGLADADDRRWLADKVGTIRNLCRAIADSTVHMGRHLAEVRDRVANFRAWVDAHFTFTHATAYKMIRVYETMGEAAGLPIDSSALYLLTGPRATAEGRAIALRIAAGGERVTPELARTILAARTPEPDARDVRRHEQRMAAYARANERGADAGAADAPDHDARLLWTILTKVLAGANRVSFDWVDDADEDRESLLTGGRGDAVRGGYLPVSMTVWPRDGGPPTTHYSNERLESILLEVAGHTPMQTCTKCRESKPLYADFAKKKNSPNGRCKRCKVCERRRVKKAKIDGREKQRKRAADAAAAALARLVPPVPEATVPVAPLEMPEVTDVPSTALAWLPPPGPGPSASGPGRTAT